jgi:lysozyme
MDELLTRLVPMLKRHEGFRQFVYRDTTGHLTVGYGHNLETGIPHAIAEALLVDDVQTACKELDLHKPWWTTLPIDAKLVLVNMTFNMGMPVLLGFRKMWAALDAQDYIEAANQMRDSVWYTQVRGRGKELADLMERLGAFTNEV